MNRYPAERYQVREPYPEINPPSHTRDKFLILFVVLLIVGATIAEKYIS